MNRSSSTKNILAVTSSFPRWKGDGNIGGGDFVLTLSTGLNTDFNVHVLAPYCLEQKGKEEVDAVKTYRHKQFFIKKIELAFGSGMTANLAKNKLLFFVVPFYFMYQFFAIAKIVRKQKIDIIHAYWLIPQGLIAVLYKLLLNPKIKIAVSVLGSDFWSFNNRIGTGIKKFIFRNIDGLSVVSEAIEQEVRKMGYTKNICVCPMGIDTNAFSPERKSAALKEKYNATAEVLLFSGYCVEGKGIRYLIQAMPAIVKQFPQVQLWLTGEGNLKEEMIELCKTLNMQNNVLFLGFVDRELLPVLHATSDIFVLPTLSEGFPIVVMEALSSGATTVVSDLPVFTQLKGKDDFMFITEKKNTQQISDTIIRLLKNKEKLAEAKSKARAFAVARFDWEHVISEHKKFLNEILNQQA